MFRMECGQLTVQIDCLVEPNEGNVVLVSGLPVVFVHPDLARSKVLQRLRTDAILAVGIGPRVVLSQANGDPGITRAFPEIHLFFEIRSR